MSRFDECLRFVLKAEGGFVDHPSDPGGATNKGVTQEVYDNYRERTNQNRNSVRFISDEEVANIYRDSYWKQIKGDSLPRGIDLVTFDAAVNHGVRQAIKFLQRALGVDDDGLIGPMTIGAAINDEKSNMTLRVIDDILNQREDFYDRLVDRRPQSKAFLKGWKNRLKHVRKEVGLA
jgi:lysozyme family protein